MQLVQLLDSKKRITAIPFQKPGFPASVGLTIADCEKQAWAIFPDSQKFGGAGAINWALAVIFRLPLPVWFYQLWGIRQLQDRIYGWVERNRSRFPGVTPFCSAFPEKCRHTLGDS